MKQTIKRLVEVCYDDLKDGRMLLDYAHAAKIKEQHDLTSFYYTRAVERYKNLHDTHTMAEKYILEHGEKEPGAWCCMHDVFMEDVKEFGDELASFQT